MQVEKIVYRPMAALIFSAEDVSVLMECSAAHYDWKCKQAGKVGGFVYGLMNRVDQSKAEAVMEFGEIDIMAKIVEMPPAHLRPQAARLRLSLSRTLHQLNAAAASVNT